MTSSEFVQQQAALGVKAHARQGVYWQRAAHGYYKPVLPFQSFPPGQARPRPAAAYLGYSHLVPNASQANRVWPCMILTARGLEQYSFGNLSYEKQKAIRKARRSNYAVERLSRLEPWLDDLAEVCESAARRLGYGKPAEYYRTHFEDWRGTMLSLFALPGREWWGVFSEGRCISYMYAYQIDETMVLDTTKCHTDHLINRASDLLHFEVLQHCRDLPACSRVYAGGWIAGLESKNRFKMTHGFERVELPIHASYTFPVRAALYLIEQSVRLLPPARHLEAGTRQAKGVATSWARIVQKAARLRTWHGGDGRPGPPVSSNEGPSHGARG